VVFFVGDRAYKLKKPVRFGFLDFRDRRVRERICHREVELNRRFAPDVYLGVADVVGPDGDPIDHLVVMRRLPTERRLATLVRSAAPLDDELRRLAHLLASFHAGAATSPAIEAAADRAALNERWEANGQEMGRFVDSVLDPQTSERVRTLAARYLAGRAPVFRDRIERGRARDGHGDLLADDVFCLDDGPRVLDCIEFDDRLRWDDVLADVAFLAMDLERLDRPDLAKRFLDFYRGYSGDTWPSSLAHHHIAYRAHVRSKVACLRWEQGDEASGVEARELLAMAAHHLDAARVRLVLIGGLPGTGKSTLALGLADALDAVVLRSDEIRKQLAGLDPLTPAPARVDEGIYRPETTARTYETLLDRARNCLEHGQSVVLDASWSDPTWRDEARTTASEAFADLDELRCVAPVGLIAARIATRAGSGNDPSDATIDVVEARARVDRPWPQASDVDTSGTPEDTLTAALDRLVTSSESSRRPAADG
jgi:aminoglycoside phosphotransferase family enzyme/predicted kinase